MFFKIAVLKKVYYGMVLSKCAICDSKKSRFIKDQEAKGLLSNLGDRTPLSKAPILGDIFFWMYMLNCI